MGFRRRMRILSSGKSPSTEAMKRTYKRAVLNGGVTVDFSANVERIREISRTLNYNILQDASFVYTPSSYGESRAYSQNPYLRNLVKYSEEFDNVFWGKLGTTVTTNSIANPIDGAVTADLITELATSGVTHRLVSADFRLTNSTSYTYSCYLKSNGRPFISLQLLDSAFGATRRMGFNLTTGVSTSLTTNVTGSMTPLTNGWYYCVMTFTSATIITNAYITPTSDSSFTQESYAGDGVSGFYAWGAMINEGTTVLPYQRTTDGIIDLQHTRATTSNVTQKDGSIGDGCYNLLQRSEEIDNAVYNLSNVTVVTNATLSPVNTLTADSITSTSVSTAFPSQILNFGTTGNTYTFSCYIKNNNATKSNLVVRNTISDVSSSINWTGNTISGITNSIGTVNYQDVGNGWYRLYTTFTNTDSVVRPRIYPQDGTSGISIYSWGWQLTKGSDLKPYLKTTNRLNVPSYDYSLSNLKASDLIQPQRTNILLNSATGTTQTRTVTAQVYTLSFYGTGSYTLSGVATGTLTGTGVSNLVTLTFTPTAGSLVLTVSGSITEVQLEAGPNATSRIRTTSASVTRNGDTSFVDLFNMNMLNKNNFTLYVEGFLKQNVATNIMVGLSDTTGTGSRANDIGVFDGIKATYTNASTISSDTFNLAIGLYYRIAIQRNGTTVKFFRNGSQKWVTQTIPVFDYRYLFVNNGGSTYTVEKIALFNRTLTDSDCVNLTNTGVPDVPIFILTSSLAAYYPLDGNTNNIGGDITTPNGVGTGVTYTAGKVGSAAVFNSPTTYIDIADTDNLSFTDGTNDIPFSISTWVYITSFNSAYNTIAYKADGTFSEWNFTIDASGSLFLSKGDKSVSSSYQGASTASGTLSLNTWYMLTATDDGSKTEAGIKLYVNGVSKTLSTVTVGTYTGMPNTTGITRLGQYPWGSFTTTNHLGYIDELGVWKNRVLTQAEITYLYNSGAGRTYPF